MDISKLPYAKWMEKTLRTLAEEKTQVIGIVGILPSRDVYTAYYNASPQDKIILAGNIQMDAVFDVMRANASDIVAAADEEGEDDE